MSLPEPIEHYLPDTTYDAIVAYLSNPSPTLDPRSRVVEILGEKANIWPERARPKDDPDPVHA